MVLPLLIEKPFNLKKNTLLKHDKDYHFTHGLNINYDPSAEINCI